jgi:hypothetical protein
MIGRFFQDEGRPKNIYFGRYLREDLARHEALVTQFVLEMQPDACVRLWNVSKKLSADAELTFGQLKIFTELDTGQSPYRKVVSRFDKYGKLLKSNELVAWVCLTQARMDGLIRRAKNLNGKGVFTVLGTGVFQDVNNEKIKVNR